MKIMIRKSGFLTINNDVSHYDYRWNSFKDDGKHIKDIVYTYNV